MKVLKGTLIFVLGMIIGIVLFVLAIGGTVVALGTAITIGDLQSKFTDQEVIASDSELYQMTLLDGIKSAIGDFQNFDQLSLKSLYEHYGVSVLNGVGGINFVGKDFYTAPLGTIMNDFSIIVNSFTLRDLSQLTGKDFAELGIPAITDNLDNNIKTALNNLQTLKDNLSIRKLTTQLLPSFDLGGNKMLEGLQDIPFDNFGTAINAIKLCVFLDTDTDTFLPQGQIYVYVKSNRYEKVTVSELKNASYQPKDGTTLFFADAIDTDDDGTTDTMVEKELRYINRGTEEAPEYAVDNSCYDEGFDADATTKTFYRHYDYERYEAGKSYPAETEFFVKGYANRVTEWNNDATPKSFSLYFKGYVSLKDLYRLVGVNYVTLNSLVNAPTIDAYNSAYKKAEDDYVAAPEYTIKAATIEKSSKLVKKDFVSDRDSYFKVHEGTSTALLQSFAYLSIGELQNMDDFVDSVTIGDIITIDEGSPEILKALADATLNNIGDKVNDLEIGQVIEINEDSPAILKALEHTTLDGMNDRVDTLKINEVIDIVFDEYTPNPSGTYVYLATATENYVLYNAKLHSGMTKYRRDGESEPYTYVADEDGTYVKNGYFTKWEAGMVGPRYDKVALNPGDPEASSLIMQALALRDCTINELGTITDDLFIYEIVDMKANDTAPIMKALAKRDCMLGNLGSVIDTLEIGEAIEITEDSPVILKSLDRHHARLNAMDTVVDELKVDEVIEVEFDTYTENASGDYVFIVYAPDEYVLYNALIHPGMTRYERIGDSEPYTYNENAEGKYVKNGYYTNWTGQVAQRYSKVVNPEASSVVMQSLALREKKITDLGNAIDSLKINEVIEIDEGSSLLMKSLRDKGTTISDLDTVIDTLELREIIEIDENSARLLKSLQNKKIGELADAMEDLTFAEIIDIYDNHQVELSDTPTESRWLVSATADAFELYDSGNLAHAGKARYNLEAGAYIKAADGEYVLMDTATTFTDDANGKYIKSPIWFEEIEDNDTLTNDGAAHYFAYTNAAADMETGTAITEGNIYYLNSGTPIHNIPLATYLYSNSDYVKLRYRTTSLDPNDTAYKVFTESDLYVKVLGTFVTYDPSNLSHANTTIYKLHKSATYDYYVRLDEYRTIQVKLSAGVYNYCTDGTGTDLYTDGVTAQFSRQYCEEIYVKDASGEFVFVDGAYEAYDSENAAHAGKPRFHIELAFLAEDTQVVNLTITKKHVDLLEEKTAPVLRMIRNDTMETMGAAVAGAQIKDLMEISPDNIFDQPSIKNSTINNLGIAMRDMMSTMTIGDLMDWANITSVDPMVKCVIEDATFENFLNSLEYSAGALSVNMETLYGY